MADLVGEKVIDGRLAGLLIECLKGLTKEAKEEIADVADDEVRKELMKGMARTMGKISPNELAIVLNKNDLFIFYTRKAFLKDLDKIADKPGLERLFRGAVSARGESERFLSDKLSDQVGALTELQAAAKFEEDIPGSVEIIRPGTSKGGADLWLTGQIYVEVTSSAIGNNDALKKLMQAKGAGASKVVIVTKRGTTITDTTELQKTVNKTRIILSIVKIDVSSDGTKTFVELLKLNPVP